MPPRAERQFPAEFVRQGGVVSKAHVTVRCCKCPALKVHEATKVLPDEVLIKRFQSWGWVLGRNRSYDICPACIGVTQVNKLADRFKVSSDGQQVPSRSEVAQAVAKERSRKSRETEALIDKTFGRPSAEPPSGPLSPPPTSDTPSLASVAPESRPAERQLDDRKLVAIEGAIISIAGDIGHIRAAMDLLMEQMGTLIGLQSQQVQAIANLSGIVARSNEGVAVGLNMLSASVREMVKEAKPPHNFPQPHSDIEIPALRLRPQTAEKPSGSEREKEEAHSSASKVRRSKTASKFGPVSINSYQDGKNPRKFYTMVQLPKALWTEFGFQSDDRIFIDKGDDETIYIRRADEGGVKLKKVTDAMVVIQTTRIGNLNFQVKQPTGSKGELQLHA